MKKFFDLSQVCLIPTTISKVDISKINLTVVDVADRTGVPKSLPIFTRPMKSLVNRGNFEKFINQGIRPILSISDPIEVRLEMCKWIFCSFTVSEIINRFSSGQQRGIQGQFHISLDYLSGNSEVILSLCTKLKRIYGSQIIIMVGSINNPDTYSEYSKVGVDYVRLSNRGGENYGFSYPMGSLLEDIKTLKRTSGVSLLKPSKIVVDDEIDSPIEIVKAIALGADYVMVGESFLNCIEAAGPVYPKPKSQSKRVNGPVISQKELDQTPWYKAKAENWARLYDRELTSIDILKESGYSSMEEYQESKKLGYLVEDNEIEWIPVNTSLNVWISKFRETSINALSLAGVDNWESYKKQAKYGIEEI